MNRRGWNQLTGGLLLIGVGVFFILQQMDIIDVSLGQLISTFWPLILIWIGLQGFIGRPDLGGAIWGAIVPLIIGLFYLGRNLGVIDFSLGDMIKYTVPVLLIGAGLTVLFKPKKLRPPHPPKPENRDYNNVEDMPEVPEAPKLESSLDEMFERTFGKNATRDHEEKPASYSIPKEEPRYREREGHWKENEWRHDETVNKSAFIGDVHLGNEYFTLKPTNISQFIGDTVLDLTKAQIPYGETKINISAFIGDVKLFIPNDSDLGVHVSTSSFIGDMTVLGQKRSGFMSNTDVENPQYREAGKKLRINISLFIGDVKVNKVG